MSANTSSNPLNALANQPKALRVVLLIVLCFTQFLDAFNNSSFFAAIPPIASQLHIDNSDSVWLISAYQLTFAAFLLSSGRLSDVYNPTYVFVSGMLLMSFCSLGAGFVRTEIPLMVLRAFMGLGAALNIPSAMALVISMFPDPVPQSRALAAFAAGAAIGNVFGLIIGASLVTFASWPWILYLAAILSAVIATLVLVLLPSSRVQYRSAVNQYSQFQRLDIPGIGILTVALVLFVFAVTSGSISGWPSPRTLIPLVASGLLIVVFALWERYLPEELASVPLSIWRHPNFPILTAIGLQPFMWWASVQLLFSWYYQEVFQWSTINVAIRFLPLGLMSFPVMGIASILQQKLPFTQVILIGDVLVLVGTSLFPFADSKEQFWRFAFPGFFIGTTGMTIVFATTNIAIFAVTPPNVAGVVGAIFMCALQLGSAAGAAIITAIQTSVEKNHGGPTSFEGRAAGFWFLFAFNAVLTTSALILLRRMPLQSEKLHTSSKEPYS
ncbi:MFS general substrate transporter [Lentinula edodes]|uniref:MFS general substrate transporter n=1 Tax=Lentinula edodes TaxID=5353 RepID=UPI001E8E4677|nr:MFS general substrate transporter [Lentinula edodes]XP_046083314.1 MFS general substrate transporter [Lentinula edodes]KAH7872214.1 MFS general substrate transporter [Lentinula edodes]KAH7872220.1 MFS general substrate transporter [Lentinula edodes]